MEVRFARMLEVRFSSMEPEKGYLEMISSLFNTYCHILRSVGFLGGFSIVRVVSLLSLDTSYLLLLVCHPDILTFLPATNQLRPSG
jgi:hypothetical protein